MKKSFSNLRLISDSARICVLMGIRRGMLAVSVALSLAIACAAALEILLFMLFIQGAITSKPAELQQLPFLRGVLTAHPDLSRHQGKTLIVAIAIALSAATVLKNTLQIFYKKYMDRHELRFSNALKEHLLDRFFRFDRRYFESSPHALPFWLLAAPEKVTKLLVTLCNGLQNFFLFTTFLSILCLISLRLAIAGAVIAPLYFYASLLTDRRQRKMQHLLTRHESRFKKHVNNSIGKLQLVKVYGQESREKRTFDSIVRRQLRFWSQSASLDRAYRPLDSVFGVALLMIVIFIDADLNDLTDPAVIAKKALALYLLKKIEISAGSLIRIFRNSKDLFYPVSQMGDFARNEPTYLLPDEGRPLAGPIESIVISNLVFGFDSSHPVLKIDSLRLNRGEVVGVSGRSGAGKTTLTKLLQRIYDPPAQSVFVNGADVRSFELDQLRQAIRVLTQETFICAGSLRENLCLACDTPPPEKFLWQLLAGLELDDRFKQLPRGLDTSFLDRGMRLSGGEMQRLALARALLADPEVLIIDEGMGGLDLLTQEKVVNLTKTLRTDRITLFISHSDSVLVATDRRIEIENGRIASDSSETSAPLRSNG